MAPDLLRYDNDLKSESADHKNEINGDVNVVSERNDVQPRMTFKDKFTSSIVADNNYLYDIQIISPLLHVSAINKTNEKLCYFTVGIL